MPTILFVVITGIEIIAFACVLDLIHAELTYHKEDKKHEK